MRPQRTHMHTHTHTHALLPSQHKPHLSIHFPVLLFLSSYFVCSLCLVLLLLCVPKTRAVVVGWDPELTYTKVAHALFRLHNTTECVLIATNLDSNFPAQRILPGHTQEKHTHNSAVHARTKHTT